MVNVMLHCDVEVSLEDFITPQFEGCGKKGWSMSLVSVHLQLKLKFDWLTSTPETYQPGLVFHTFPWVLHWGNQLAYYA